MGDTTNMTEDERRRAAQTQRDAEAEARAARDRAQGNIFGEFGAAIWQMIAGFFQFLMDTISGRDNGGDGDTTIEAPGASSTVSLFNGIRATAAGARAWAEYQREHRGEPVRHRSPIAGDATVGDDRHMRERHPVSGNRRMHHGVDFGHSNSSSQEIIASASGVVLFSGSLNGYGKTVIIGHSDGTYTLYGHLTGARMPTPGEEVAQGEQIGVMGNTGGSTGTHLHYEQRRGSQSLVPVINGEQATRGTRVRHIEVPNLAALGVSGDTGQHTAPGNGSQRVRS